MYGTFSWSWPVSHHEMTGRFVVLTSSTRRWIAELTSTRSSSADLLCDALSILSRSPGPLHRHRPLSKVFFSVSVGNDFIEDRIGTITSEFHEKELDADRIRTAADELQKEEVLLCDLCEFVLVESCSEDWLLPPCMQSVAAHFVVKVFKSISSCVT